MHEAKTSSSPQFSMNHEDLLFFFGTMSWLVFQKGIGFSSGARVSLVFSPGAFREGALILTFESFEAFVPEITQ
jgi:hypothetical protein